MTPTSARPMFIFTAAIRVGTLPGSTTLVSTCQRLAPKVWASLTLFRSIPRKPAYTTMMVTNTAMATAMPYTA
ncbi:hypothetical protein G6F22_022062 [Rhizopus arrhizus]|nr:hypothetical protein G6F22_022062 [Rhizopus arrhizus]